MRKLLLSTCLAASMLCSAFVPCALAAEPQTVISSEAVTTLFPRTWINHSTAQSVDYEFSSIAGAGKFIQVNYFNSSKVPATVYLYQKSAGNNTEVMQFEVAAGENNSKEYINQNDDSASDYFIMVECKGGSTEEGYLTVFQLQQDIVQIPFTDVPANAWYRPQIEYVYENGLFSGTSKTTFSPEQDMTRAQIITVLGNMHQKLTGETIEGEISAFSDVPDNIYYEKYIDWAQKNGIVAGFTDGKFHPNDVITREQLAVIVNKYVQISGKTLTASREYKPFADEDQISSWAKDAVVNMVKYGFMSGKANNQFSPKDSVTRAEGATVIADLHKTLV